MPASFDAAYNRAMALRHPHRAHPRIIVLGSANMDLAAVAPTFPEPGETLLGNSFQATPGGKGANQAVAAARLGAQAVFIGRVGRDPFGDALARELEASGVNIDALARDDDAPTGVAHIQVNKAGENKIIIAPGANATCGPSEMERLRRALPGADALLLQMELPIDASLEAARQARDFGCRVIFDPAPASPLPEEEYALLDAILPNEREAAVLTNVAIVDQATAAEAAHVLQDRGVPIAVVKLGARGAYYACPQNEGHTPAFQVDAVDSVGAGDAFCAAFAVAVAEGHPVSEAVRWGAAAGAIATTRQGAQRAMPRRQDIINLLKTAARPTSG